MSTHEPQSVAEEQPTPSEARTSVLVLVKMGEHQRLRDPDGEDGPSRIEHAEP